MSLTLELLITCRSAEEAASLQRVLAPDNRAVPKDQTFSSRAHGRTLRFSISSARFSGCFSSGISILTDVRLFQDVWSTTA